VARIKHDADMIERAIRHAAGAQFNGMSVGVILSREVLEVIVRAAIEAMREDIDPEALAAAERIRSALDGTSRVSFEDAHIVAKALLQDRDALGDSPQNDSHGECICPRCGIRHGIAHLVGEHPF
jgi:hypothetical protein